MAIIITTLVTVMGGVWYLSSRISSVGSKLDAFIDSRQREHGVSYDTKHVLLGEK